MRLGFSVAMHVDPDVLIVDEALAVGDAHFQQKCVERNEGFQQRGKTLLIVSHDMEMIRRFCHRAIWLQHGQVVADGSAKVVTVEYEDHLRRPTSEPPHGEPDWTMTELTGQV